MPLDHPPSVQANPEIPKPPGKRTPPRKGSNGGTPEGILIGAQPGTRYQFERVGYFCVDKDSTPEKLVFNRTVTLRDTWAKIEKAMKGKVES